MILICAHSYVSYIYIYTDALAVLLVHVGLAQARPNYTLWDIIIVVAR